MWYFSHFSSFLEIIPKKMLEDDCVLWMTRKFFNFFILNAFKHEIVWSYFFEYVFNLIRMMAFFYELVFKIFFWKWVRQCLDTKALTFLLPMIVHHQTLLVKFLFFVILKFGRNKIPWPGFWSVNFKVLINRVDTVIIRWIFTYKLVLFPMLQLAV